MNASRNTVVALTTIVTLFTLQARAEQRTWTDTYGNTIEAELVENLNGTVTLANEDGREAHISISELSADDQKYVLVNTPPKITIKVNELTDRKNKGLSFENPNNDAYDRDVQIQTTSRSFNVTLEKGSIPYNRPIQAELYVIGYKKAAEEFVLQSKTVKNVDFDQEGSKNKFVFTSDPITTRDLQGGRHVGVEFHGYLVALVDDKGHVFDMRSSRSRMQENASLIRKREVGATVKKADVEFLINQAK